MARRSGFAFFQLLGAAFAFGACGLPHAHATLQWYYDPLTGNVAFDTANTRNGLLHSYSLSISPLGTAPFNFRTENFIHISTSTLFTNTPKTIGDSTQGTQWEGLYTIG